MRFLAAADIPASGDDVLLAEARKLAQEHGRISTSFLQRRLNIGYPRAARLMDVLEAEGLGGRGEAGKPRPVAPGDVTPVHGAGTDVSARTGPEPAPSDEAVPNGEETEKQKGTG